jgi:hypothetical protein
VELEDGTPAFVKFGADPMLPVEIEVYRSVRAAFMPLLLGSHLGDGEGVLVIEDLSAATWPPPYPDDVDALLAAVEAIGDTPPPPGLRLLKAAEGTGWQRVADDPARFLTLGACSRPWLESALPTLIDAEPRATRVGEDFLHYDIWGANLCFADERVLLIDWGAAVRGDRRLDLAFTLFALRYEAGRSVSVDFPEEGAYAAELAVSQALQALEPLPAWAPPGSTLRTDQAAVVGPALAWAAEKLGLPPPTL